MEIVEGLKIALDNIDEVIRIIKASRDNNIAKTALMDAFGFSERQAHAYFGNAAPPPDRFGTGKIEAEMAELQKTIAWLEEVLGDRNLLIGIIKEDLQRVREKYGDERRTSLQADAKELDIEDLIAEEDMVITITNSGYIKRLAPTIIAARSEAAKV